MNYYHRNHFLNHCVTEFSNLEKRFPQCSKRILISNIIPPTIDYYWNAAVSAMR